MAIIGYIKLKNNLKLKQMQQKFSMTKYNLILSLKIGDFIYVMRQKIVVFNILNTHIQRVVMVCSFVSSLKTYIFGMLLKYFSISVHAQFS